MFRIIVTFLALAFFTNVSFSQEKLNQEVPYIEVIGFAEKEIIPDEIFLSVTLREREENRVIITIEKQEADLKAILNSLSIPLENLTISDAQADFIRVKLNRKDVVSQSEYQLKLKNAKEIADVVNKLDEIKIHQVYISKVSHSKIKEYNKELEIEAIKAAKDKAMYLTAAIDQKIGGAIHIKENESNPNIYQIKELDYLDKKAYYRNSSADIAGKLSETISFQKIKLFKAVNVKFEVK